jgi:hypothetical protein
MDGRVQTPVIRFLQERFGAEYVDSITEPGPNLILSEQKDTGIVQSILNRLSISVEKHRSVGVAIAGHYDCAGNPAPRDEQVHQLHDAVRFLRQQYSEIPIIALWVDKRWQVTEVPYTERVADA